MSFKLVISPSSALSEMRAWVREYCAAARASCSTCSGQASRAPESSAARAGLRYSVSARPHSRCTTSARRDRLPSATSIASLTPMLNWRNAGSPCPTSPARRLLSAMRSRVNSMTDVRARPVTAMRSCPSSRSMNAPAAFSAAPPSRRRMCASSTATTTRRPSSSVSLVEKCSGAARRRPAAVAASTDTNCAETMRRGRPSTLSRKSAASKLASG